MTISRLGFIGILLTDWKIWFLENVNIRYCQIARSASQCVTDPPTFLLYQSVIDSHLIVR